jgi:4-hydroxyphenylpyruvate dioxygenase-like putative hemolysin
MRLDHIAYRVSDRLKAVKFFKEAFGYKEQSVFELKFDNGTTCDCTALEPPEKVENAPWQFFTHDSLMNPTAEYHMAPEIFVSEGQPGSIVEQWIKERNGVGGIHHLAYQVASVENTMKEWQEKGYAEFCSEEPLTCPGLTQVFTKPSDLTGIIYEFITRGEHGFCTENVKSLMESTVIQS